MNDTARQGPMSLEEIRAAAERLATPDRIKLVEALLETLPHDQDLIDDLWVEEIESRMAAVRSGDMQLVDAREVFEEFKRK